MKYRLFRPRGAASGGKIRLTEGAICVIMKKQKNSFRGREQYERKPCIRRNTMSVTARSFMTKLESRDLKYTYNEAIEGRNENVRVSFNGKYGNTVALTFFIDPDGTTVNIKVFTICKCLEEKLMEMYVQLNQLNYEYRWVKFYLDEDNEVTVSGDAVVTPETAGEELFELMARYLNIIDEVYPRIMKVVIG